MLSLICFCDITKGLIISSENQSITATNQIYINKEQKDEHEHQQPTLRPKPTTPSLGGRARSFFCKSHQ